MTPDPPPGSVPPPQESRGAQWPRIKELFQRALDLPTDQRRTWLAAAAGPDAELFREVDALLAAHDTDGGFLREPPGVAPVDVHIFPSGTHLGPYEILDELGRGGSGIVYLALDLRLGRQVALKLVAAGANQGLRDRLRREARAVATIAHPSVATIHALEEFDDQLFIVSEYVRGRTLRTVLADGPVAGGRVIAIARDMAGALRAAHEVGVIHRDLKPENILLSDTGAVKIVDFGIARIVDDVTQLTRHGALLGTPAYMAPEQLLGTEVDARADIYAFGIVLLEMLTGHHPGLTDATRTGDNQPDDLTQIARQCTQLDPAGRFQTAAQLIAALDQLERPVRPGSPSRWWWEFHQASVATVYWLTLWPAWVARSAIGGPLGRAFFVLILAAVVVSAFLRLHLWFTSRFYADELPWVRHRSKPWIRVADAAFSSGLLGGALLIRTEHSSIDVLLLSIGVGAAVAFLFIESATARAAFGNTKKTP